MTPRPSPRGQGRPGQVRRAKDAAQKEEEAVKSIVAGQAERKHWLEMTHYLFTEALPNPDPNGSRTLIRGRREDSNTVRGGREKILRERQAGLQGPAKSLEGPGRRPEGRLRQAGRSRRATSAPTPGLWSRSTSSSSTSATATTWARPGSRSRTRPLSFPRAPTRTTSRPTLGRRRPRQGARGQGLARRDPRLHVPQRAEAVPRRYAGGQHLPPQRQARSAPPPPMPRPQRPPRAHPHTAHSDKDTYLNHISNVVLFAAETASHDKPSIVGQSVLDKLAGGGATGGSERRPERRRRPAGRRDRPSVRRNGRPHGPAERPRRAGRGRRPTAAGGGAGLQIPRRLETAVRRSSEAAPAIKARGRRPRRRARKRWRLPRRRSSSSSSSGASRRRPTRIRGEDASAVAKPPAGAPNQGMTPGGRRRPNGRDAAAARRGKPLAPAETWGPDHRSDDTHGRGRRPRLPKPNTRPRRRIEQTPAGEPPMKMDKEWVLNTSSGSRWAPSACCGSSA